MSNEEQNTDPEKSETTLEQELKKRSDEEQSTSETNGDKEEIENQDKIKESEKSEESEGEEEKEEVEMVEIPKNRLEELENAEAIAIEKIKRERAESINYRKRLQKQRDDFAEIASARVLTKLLAVQDDLKRILENGKDAIPDEHLEGIELLKQRVDSIFESEGVSLIPIKEGKTKYDPQYHEAIVTQPVPDVPPKTILNVVSQGFVKGDRVLRPSKVIISKQPTPPKEEEENIEESKTEEKDDDNDSSQKPEPEEPVQEKIEN